MPSDPFTFEWPVDQAGYQIEVYTPEELEADRALHGGGLLGGRKMDRISRKGGPLRYYYPLQEEGLWRRFGDTCATIDGMQRFIDEFGLLSDTEQDFPSWITSLAARIAQIGDLVDAGDRIAAAEFLNGRPPQIAEMLDWNSRTKRFETRLTPSRLSDALLHQAAEAISGNRQWRRCRNLGCPHWFRVGQGARTMRREFCSDRCRVASARREKQAEKHEHA